jgi:hypothetical protein
MTHLSDEMAYALASATLAGREGGGGVREVGVVAPSQAEQHLRECVRCRQRVERARVLLRAVEHATPAVEPAADWWPAIRASIEARSAGTSMARRRDTAERGAWGPRGAVRATAQHAWRWRAAAALVVAVSASAAVVVARRRTAEPYADQGGAIDVRPVPRAAASMQVNTSPMDASNDARVERQLLAELELRKGELRPATVAQVEANLRTIDQAIADVRTELTRDPNNPALTQILADSYAHKAELLKLLANAS